MDAIPEDERREHPRYPIERNVELALADGRFIAAEGKNLSENGILIESEQLLGSDTKLLITLSIPTPESDEGWHDITCEGVVVRTTQIETRYRSGILFTSIRREDRQLLMGFLAEYASDAVN